MVTRTMRAVAAHGRAVVSPVRVLAGDPPVVVHQSVHGVRQVDDLGVPSTWTHSPKKPSLNTHSEARGLRARFLALMAVSLVLMSTRPSSSTAHDDRRQLRTAVGTGGGQHRPMVGAQELPGACR